jgi:hypothetical protein
MVERPAARPIWWIGADQRRYAGLRWTGRWSSASAASTTSCRQPDTGLPCHRVFREPRGRPYGISTVSGLPVRRLARPAGRICRARVASYPRLKGRTLSTGFGVVAGQPVLGVDVDRAHAVGGVPGGLDVAVSGLVAQVAAGELPALLDGDGVLDAGDRALDGGVPVGQLLGLRADGDPAGLADQLGLRLLASVTRTISPPGW